MDQNQLPQYTGTVWSSEGKTGTSYRISISAAKIKDIEPDAYGNILLSISKRREQHPVSKATHNIYLCRDAQNYLSDKYALLNVSINKEKVLSLESSYGNCEIVALRVSEQSREKDHARATHVVTNNLPKESRAEASNRIHLGKAWVINGQSRQTQITGDKPTAENAGKLYVGNGILKRVGEARFINVIIDREKLQGLSSPNGHVYINLSERKDRESELTVYHSQSKYDRWAQYTLSLDREKTLSITPTENGYLPITLSYRKGESIGRDNANINVRANFYRKDADRDLPVDGKDASPEGPEKGATREDFFVGKGWSRDNMYWMQEREGEIPQVQTIEKTPEMEGMGVTNLGLHIFQTVKADPGVDASNTTTGDTSNAYFLKEGRVYQQHKDHSILPFDGYPIEDFMQNYETLSEGFQSSVFYNTSQLSESEKSVFLSNASAENTPGKDEKKNSLKGSLKTPKTKLKNAEIKAPQAKTAHKTKGKEKQQKSGLTIG